jgi:membrane protein YqaA with SNARE-associated domain
LANIIELIKDFLNHQFVQDYGLLAVFFVHMSPSFLFLMEGVDSTAVLSGLNPIAIIIFAGVGGAIGDLLWYYAGLYSYRKIKKIDSKKTIRLIHHHKRLPFLYSAFPGGEILMVYAGIKHFKIYDIFPFVIASNALRASIIVGILTGIITFIPEVLKDLIL